MCNVINIVLVFYHEEVGWFRASKLCAVRHGVPWVREGNELADVREPLHIFRPKHERAGFATYSCHIRTSNKRGIEGEVKRSHLFLCSNAGIDVCLNMRSHVLLHPSPTHSSPYLVGSVHCSVRNRKKEKKEKLELTCGYYSHRFVYTAFHTFTSLFELSSSASSS